jgi:hypothetical protein
MANDKPDKYSNYMVLAINMGQLLNEVNLYPIAGSKEMRVNKAL